MVEQEEVKYSVLGMLLKCAASIEVHGVEYGIEGKAAAPKGHRKCRDT